MHRYMKRCPKPYMSIVRANVDGEFETLVRTRPVGQWRETLALLATYTSQVRGQVLACVWRSGALAVHAAAHSQPPAVLAVSLSPRAFSPALLMQHVYLQEDWAQLCDVLAQRLHAAGMHHAASLCHICAGNVDGVVAYWARTVGGAAKVEALQGVIEKAVIMGLATGSKKASVALSELVTSYASILAAQVREAPGAAAAVQGLVRSSPVPRGCAWMVIKLGVP